MNDFLAAEWGMGLAAEPVGELWFSSSEFKSGTYPTQPRQRFDLRVPPLCRAGWAGARQVIGWGRPDEPRFFPQSRIGFPAPGTVGGYGLVSRPRL
jgi:hypothetical protein